MTAIPEELRRAVRIRAAARCAYCRLHADDAYFVHEIDHIYAEKHHGPIVAWNLCLACADCNQYKGSDLCSYDHTSDQVITLFYPRRDTWADHVQLVATGVIEPISATGRVTARRLRFNRFEKERR
jgi:5-methylcytosine-specific restriction endonuclease McrA